MALPPRQRVDPLNWQTPIVDPATGRPTIQFIQLWERLFGNETDTNLTAEEALELVEEIVSPKPPNTVYSGPDTGPDDAAPTFRALVEDDLPDSGATPGVYGDATNVPQITVDAKGRITDVIDVAISGGGGGVDVEDEGTPTVTGATTLNFIGSAVTVTDAGGGVADVTITDPVITLGALDEYDNYGEPSAPSDGMTLFTRLRTNRHALAGIADTGTIIEYQQQLANQGQGWWTIGDFGLTITSVGFSGGTVGSATLATRAAGTLLGTTPHLVYRSTAAINSAGGFWTVTNAARSPLTRGSASGTGGFFLTETFSINAVNSSSVLAMGACQRVTALTTFTSQTNFIGVGARDTDTNLQIIQVDGTAANIVFNDLGSGFPAKTAGEIYTLEMQCSPNGSAIEWRLYRWSTNTSTGGTLNTAIPANTEFVHPFLSLSTGPSVSTAVELGVMRGYWQCGPLPP